MLRERSLRVLLLTIPLLLLANALRPPLAVGGLSEARFWAEKLSHLPTYEVVLAGDSRVTHGLSPAEMAKILPRRTLNFGFPSACLNRTYLEEAAGKLVASRWHPTLVIGLSPYSLTERAAQQSRFLDELRVGRLVRWYRQSPGPAEFFAPYFAPQHPGDRRGTEHTDHTYFSDGWDALRREHEDPLANQAHYRENFAGNRVSAQRVEEFVTMVLELRRRGVRVIVFRYPVYAALHQLEDELSGFDEAGIRARLRDAGAVWLEVDHRRYRYFDGSHMAADVARQFSRELAQRLAALETGR